MSEAALHLVLAAFEGETGAGEALKSLKESRDEKLVGIQAAVAMRKDGKGQLHFEDVGMTPARGAAGGVVLGAVVGLLTGGTGLALGALGALVGGLVGRKKRDSRFPTNRINQVAASLDPGSSALLIVMEQGWVVVLEKELEALGGDVLAAEIPSDIAGQTQEERDAAFDALVRELGIAPAGSAGGD
jgi:uncharacterized membrane protein